MFQLTKKNFLGTVIATTLVIPLFSLSANAVPNSVSGAVQNLSVEESDTVSGSTLGKNPISILSTSVTIKPYAKNFQGEISAIIAPGTSKAAIEKTVDRLVNKVTVSIPLTLEQKTQLKQELVQAIQDGLIAQSVQKVPIVVNYHAEGTYAGQPGVNINWSNEIYILIR
jgi:hypothetical protein